jgi:hypothetical protein
VDFAGTPNRARKDRENFVTYQATYSLAGPPELRWGNLKGMSAWIERFAPSSDYRFKNTGGAGGSELTHAYTHARPCLVLLWGHM